LTHTYNTVIKPPSGKENIMPTSEIDHNVITEMVQSIIGISSQQTSVTQTLAALFKDSVVTGKSYCKLVAEGIYKELDGANNKALVNTALSALRTQMARACKVVDKPKQTVKAIADRPGRYKVVASVSNSASSFNLKKIAEKIKENSDNTTSSAQMLYSLMAFTGVSLTDLQDTAVMAELAAQPDAA